MAAPAQLMPVAAAAVVEPQEVFDNTDGNDPLHYKLQGDVDPAEATVRGPDFRAPPARGDEEEAKELDDLVDESFTV